MMQLNIILFIFDTIEKEIFEIWKMCYTIIRYCNIEVQIWRM